MRFCTVVVETIILTSPNNFTLFLVVLAAGVNSVLKKHFLFYNNVGIFCDMLVQLCMQC